MGPHDRFVAFLELRKSKRFQVEVDATPGGYTCSASLKRRCAAAELGEVVTGRQPLRRLFSKQQRAFFSTYAPVGIDLDDLSTLGPVHVTKLKTSPPGFDRKLAVELWKYPDRPQILELSTRRTPGEAFEVAAEARAFLDRHGLGLVGEPQTKTRITLQYFAARIDSSEGGASG